MFRLTNNNVVLLLAAVAAVALFAHAPGVQVAAQAVQGSTTASAADVICYAPDLSTLCKIIDAAGSAKTASDLSDPTSILTVFAPTNEAFEKDGNNAAKKLGLKRFEDFFTSPQACDKLLRGLIVPGQALTSTAFKSGAKYKNVKGSELTYSTAWFTDQVYISSSQQKAEIVQKDIRAGAGIIHVVDRVPYPSS